MAERRLPPPRSVPGGARAQTKLVERSGHSARRAEPALAVGRSTAATPDRSSSSAFAASKSAGEKGGCPLRIDRRCVAFVGDHVVALARRPSGMHRGCQGMSCNRPSTLWTTCSPGNIPSWSQPFDATRIRLAHLAWQAARARQRAARHGERYEAARVTTRLMF